MRLAGALTVVLVAAAAVGWRLRDPRTEPAPVVPVAPPLPAFVPKFLGAELHARDVRPGDPLSYVLRFTNEGPEPAAQDLTVFVHLEAEDADCGTVTAQHDHEPRFPTRVWRPGATIVDGPRLLVVPATAESGDYRLHVGLFDRQGDGRRRVDDRSTRVRIDRGAVAAEDWDPQPLSPPEVALRAAHARERMVAPVTLRTPAWTFALDAATGAFALEDLRTGATSGSDPDARRALTAIVRRGEFAEEIAIERFDDVRLEAAGLHARASVRLDPEPLPAAQIDLDVLPTEDGAGARITWSASSDDGRIAALRLLDHALQATDAEDGALVLPCYLGEVFPCDRGLPHERLYRQRDLTMAMCGVLSRGNAVLVAWSDLGTELRTHLEVRDSPRVAGRRIGSLSLDLPAGPGWMELHPLGAGDHVALAKAYRAIAERRGLRRTWAAKKAVASRIERLEGAPVFRFACLQRLAPLTRRNALDHEVVDQLYHFDEIARCAEHWRNDLGLQRAHVIVAGWGREGYDSGHPDVLPANAESGGDAGLNRLSRRIDELGYLLTLHDNYTDIYSDAPSYDPARLRRDDHDAPRKGGQWAGGQAWGVCPREQLAFAERNFPRIAELYAPGAIFLDTTLTPPLEPCHDPHHPLTVATDREARKRLYALARSTFGLLGLEGGTEWAVADAHWFEGLLTHKTIHRKGHTVVPLLPMVFGDCLALVPIQADKLDVDDARKVLDLALYGQMPSFQLGPHAYFEEKSTSVPLRAEVAGFEATTDRRFQLKLRWHVDGPVQEDVALFVHFTRDDSPAAEGIDLQADARPAPASRTWKGGEVIETITPLLELPADAEGPWQIQVGAHSDHRRFSLEGSARADRRTTIAVLRREGGRLQVCAPECTSGDDVFARADGGWAAGLPATDRLIKNVVEVLGPLQARVAGVAMTDHKFLTADHSVERTAFGDVRVTVNYGNAVYADGFVSLPRFGIRIESPTFVAVHAVRFAGMDYPDGVLFTLTSLDGLPLPESRAIRIYHGFGDRRLRLDGRTIEVARETVWTPDRAPR